MSSPVGSNHAKIELQGISQRCDTLCTTGILRDTNCLSPVVNVVSDPSSNQWFSMEVVNWASEEALHLRSMQIDGNNVVDASDV